MATSPSTPAAADHGYIYDLLRKLGLTDFGARTGQFLFVRPIRVALIVLGNDVSGTVEDLNLRVTRVRATDGTVYFVPNGEIHRVGNASMEWSRALIDVLVAYDNDLSQVIDLINDESQAFAADPAWKEAILEPPEVWGVQSMTTDGATIRLVVKTAPRRQYAVARELRGRISNR